MRKSASRGRFGALVNSSYETADRGIQHERPAFGCPRARVDVQRDLLQVLDQPRLELDKRAAVRPDGLDVLEGCLMGLARRREVAIQVVDEP